MKCVDFDKGKFIYDYCLGLLKEEEVKAFELHLYECEFCRKKLCEIGTFCSVLYKIREKKDSSLIKIRKFLAIAASLLFLIPGIKIFGKLVIPPNNNPYVEKIIRGNNFTSEHLLIDGIDKFNKKNFKEAEHIFYEFLKKNPESFNGNLYLGLSLINENNKKGFNYLKKCERYAENIFKKTGNYRYLAKVYYYMGINLLKFNNSNEAKKYLKKYLDFKDPFLVHNFEVKNILERLR